MTQDDSSRETEVPRLAFLGFCDRAEEITEGHTLFWRLNLLGLSKARAFYVFPTNLRGLKLALAIFRPKAGDSFSLTFRGMQGQPSFDFSMAITSVVYSEAGQDSSVSDTEHTAGVAEAGWAFVPSEISTDILVTSPGSYEVFLNRENEQQYVGAVTLAQISLPPYTAEELTALKSDPLATKFVRMNIGCNSCHDEMKAYAGVERSPSLEAQGFCWNHDITSNEFLCSCGRSRFSLIPIRTGLHGLLRRNINPKTDTNISAVRLYEQTTLEEYCRELLRLIEVDSREEVLQNFLESHPIFFHVFLPKKIIFKPPILTKYVADFAVLNARDELLLIEIERPGIVLLKKDGDITADLSHAFHQVRTWTQVLNDHRAAALEAIGLKLDEVTRVRSVVVAGRKPSDERQLKMLRPVSTAETELFTYDDLLTSVTELIKHVANV